MRDYEAVYLFPSASSSEEIEGKLEKYHGLVTGGGGELAAVEHWGKRHLAYPIRKQTSAHYVVTQFSADPEVIPELERMLRMDEDLLRHLIVLREGELPTPPHARGLEDEEDEEDEDEDEEEDADEEDEEED